MLPIARISSSNRLDCTLRLPRITPEILLELRRAAHGPLAQGHVVRPFQIGPLMCYAQVPTIPSHEKLYNRLLDFTHSDALLTPSPLPFTLDRDTWLLPQWPYQNGRL